MSKLIESALMDKEQTAMYITAGLIFIFLLVGCTKAMAGNLEPAFLYVLNAIILTYIFVNTEFEA